MFHLTDTRLRTPCEMPYQREHAAVNRGVVSSSLTRGAIYDRQMPICLKALDFQGLFRISGVKISFIFMAVKYRNQRLEPATL